jgi:uncharacterized membrane protein
MRPRTRRGISKVRKIGITNISRTQEKGAENMLGIIAAVLIVLWLLGFFAFHVTTGFIHIALVVALILLVLHFMTGRTASA